MHSFCRISSVMWEDKKVVLLVSSHALPVDPPNVPRTVVPQRSGPNQEFLPSSLMHLEYTTYMRKVDVAYQLQASYSCQIQSHKWWHRVF